MTKIDLRMATTILVWLGFCSTAIWPTSAKADDRDDQIRCVKEGRIFAKDFKQEWANPITPISDNPEFHFNKKLQTCLAFTGVFSIKQNDAPNVWRLQAITDVYSNKILIYTRSMTDDAGKVVYVELKNAGDAFILNYEDFSKEKETLFRE